MERVISLLEPWASLIKEKKKYVETRSWKTNYRGELYIHASKKELTKKDYITYKEILDLLDNTTFLYGYIIVKCRLVDCKYMDDRLIEEIRKDHQEYICGEYAVGRYAWILEDIEVLEKPIPVKGHLGIWKYDENNPEE